MLNTILDTIYQAYLENDFVEEFGLDSSNDFGNSSWEFLDDLRNSNARVTVKTKKGDTVLKRKWYIEDIIGIAVAQGEEVGFKNGFLVGLLFGSQVNSKPMNFN